MNIGYWKREAHMFEYSPAWPHGALQSAFADVYFVVGTNKTHHAGTDLQTSRTMVILRDGGALTLVNTVRLAEHGLDELEELGQVRNVVRLGAFHGRDDPFYRDRYGATTWALPGVRCADGRPADRELDPTESFPAHGGKVFVFSTAAFPEAAVVLPQEGGILITCDAVQDWTRVDPFFSKETGESFLEQGLIGAANIPSTWLGACSPDVADYRRLISMTFRHLITAHGEPLRDDAQALLQRRITAAFTE
ncbi:hypothetical protein [Sorangium sp. So ce1078]|uniref:hypothetical protein n=1 Tax=Sorangium sp. So ce1078 TaxID=3133329 RepID=UPI003F5F2152